MKRHWKKILILLASLLFPLCAFSGSPDQSEDDSDDPPFYSAKNIRGQVVVAETGQPLEGVIVVARWRLNWTTGPGSAGGTINTLEAVTDKEGKFFIPGWGPRPRPAFGYLNHLDPELRFFKSNFYPVGLANRLFSYEHHNRSAVRTSMWDGKVIQLKPFKGDDWGKYASQLRGNWSSEFYDCLRECPRFVLALDKESKRIKASAPKGTFYPMVLNIENFSEGNREFLKRFKDEK